MTMVKNSMMALMRRMMLTCEEATFLSTKSSITGINSGKKMQLHMHMAACKHCRKFFKQTNLITKNIRHYTSTALQGNIPAHRMSSEEKAKLQKLIHNKIQSA